VPNPAGSSSDTAASMASMRMRTKAVADPLPPPARSGALGSGAKGGAGAGLEGAAAPRCARWRVGASWRDGRAGEDSVGAGVAVVMWGASGRGASAW
jgi:hypothetical protein